MYSVLVQISKSALRVSAPFEEGCLQGFRELMLMKDDGIDFRSSGKKATAFDGDTGKLMP